MAETLPRILSSKINTGDQEEGTDDIWDFGSAETQEDALAQSLEIARDINEGSLAYNIIDSDGVFRGLRIDFIGSVWTDFSIPPEDEPSKIIH